MFVLEKLSRRTTWHYEDAGDQDISIRALDVELYPNEVSNPINDWPSTTCGGGSLVKPARKAHGQAIVTNQAQQVVDRHLAGKEGGY